MKLHGTSGRTGYLPLIRQKKQKWWQKLLKKHPGTYTEYGYVTGTRRVVLDDKHDGGYYSDNQFRVEMAKKFEGKLHKGETVYYEIVGFVTRGRGISIHRTDCVNVVTMSEMDRSRLIEAEWQQPDKKAAEKYLAEISVYSNNRTGLLVDLSRVFTEKGIDLTSLNSRVSKQGTASLSVTFEISGTEELNKIIEKLRQIDSIIDIERAAT